MIVQSKLESCLVLLCDIWQSQNELELTVPALYVNKSTKILTEVKSSHINAQTGNALRLLSNNFIDKGLRLMALRNELFLKVLKI